ncbi:MAG TPA: serine hydrolase domain-containing protein [Thermoanaerobaculia bacterium]|nr:serine hydrolase domain-containing protein [Thermoanaerobaculia bacterium]
MKRISVIVLILMFAIPLAAQKRVIRGGPPEAPKDLPPLEVREGMSDDEQIAALDRYVTALAEKGLFSGTVLLARDGKPRLSRAVGLADREKKSPMTIDTKMNLGSINKLFTKVAIAQLAAAGKLKLTDTVAALLPSLDIPSADAITIEQLLEHRSGLGDFFGPRFFGDPHRIATLADYATLFAGKPLEFEPGKGQRYSNAGYIVLGLIIEAKSGESYHDYVQRHIFAPAGMRDSGAWAWDADVANRAVGYTKRGPEGPLPELRPNVATLPGRGSSAGGGYSTAPDLLRFANAFTAGKFVDGEWSGWLTQGKLGAPAGPIGLGVAGGAPGINAALEIDGPWTLAVLANLDPPAAVTVAEAWMKLRHPEGEEDDGGNE